MDANVLNYKIDSFDEIKKIVKVTFDDGAWAQIQLISPYPTNLQELENQIKMYAPSVEHLESRTHTANLDFISNNIGTNNSCERRYERSSTQPTQNELAAAADGLDIQELQRTLLRAAIERTIAGMVEATV